MSERRTVVWFSAGAASAVAAKLTLAEGPAVLAYTDPGSEHPDNERFIKDCEEWFGQEVIRLRSPKYVDTWQVWSERRFLNSPQGALCTTELKKKVRQAFERPDDRQVFGYTVEERMRATRFREQNPGVDLITPLIDLGLPKSECLRLVQQAGITLPAMYRLGYRNNNCVGCVKGGIGYWNKIRRDFPDVFARMAVLERELDATVLRESIATGAVANIIGDHDEPVTFIERKSVPLFLDALDPRRGNHDTEADIQCSLFCSVGEL
jgi:hypothetical protein